MLQHFTLQVFQHVTLQVLQHVTVQVLRHVTGQVLLHVTVLVLHSSECMSYRHHSAGVTANVTACLITGVTARHSAGVTAGVVFSLSVRNNLPMMNMFSKNFWSQIYVFFVMTSRPYPLYVHRTIRVDSILYQKFAL